MNKYTGWIVTAILLGCFFVAAIVVVHSSTLNTGSATTALDHVGAIDTDGKSANGQPTLVEFGATWCHFCVQEKPVIEELKGQAGGKLNFRSVDVDNEKDEATRYQVQGIPLLVLLSGDGKVLWRHEGYLAKDDLVAGLKAGGVSI